MRALVDSIEVIEHQSATSTDNLGEPVRHRFERVLVQPVDKRQVTGGAGDSAQLQHIGNTLVFIDAINSVNVDGYSVKLGDKVEYGGVTRQVIQIDALKAWLPTPHHWEVWLQ